MKKKLNRLELIDKITKMTNTTSTEEIFKNYINFDGDEFQLQFLQHKSFGLTFRDIVFLSEKHNTDIYHEEIKQYLKELYSHMNLTLKTNNVFSVI